MAHERLGGQPARYSFLLNPYFDQRLSKCPKCGKLTQMRKFPLFIHIDECQPIILGKTCRYCSRCELIMAHQDELEAELAHSLSKLAPDVIGNDYVVLGTMDRKTWQQHLEGSPQTLEEGLKHVAEFKEYLTLHVEPGGWQPIEEVEPASRKHKKK